MAGKSEEFQQNLGTPSDYQRPVQTKAEAPDIFGGLAKLWDNLNTAGRGSGSSGPSQTEIENLRKNKGLDTFAAGVADIQLGRVENSEALKLLGPDFHNMMLEIQRVDQAGKEGEISFAARQVQIENLTTSVMSAYPEASYEVMGEALSKLGVDHVFARNYQSQIMAADADRASEAASRSKRIELATSAGYTGSPETLAAQGLLLQQELEINRKLDYKMKLDKERADAQARNDAATLASLNARNKAVSNEIANGLIRQSSIGLENTFELIHSLSITADTDPVKNKALGEAFQAAKRNLQVGRQKAEQLATQNNLENDDRSAVSAWYDRQDKLLDEMMTGPASNGARVTSMLNILKNTGLLEAQDLAGTYGEFVAAFGPSLAQQVIEGKIVGVTNEVSQGLRDEFIRSINTSSFNAAEKNARIMAFKSALSGANIPLEADPEKRAKLVTDAAVGLKGALSSLNSLKGGKPAQIDLENFRGASVTLMSAAMQDSPTITSESLDKILPVLFSGQWRLAAHDALKNDADREKITQAIKMNGLVDVSILDTMQRKYVSTGKVILDKTTGKFVAGTKFSPSPVGVRALESNRPVSFGNTGPDPEGVKAAAQMNKLIEHLEFMDKEVPLMPPGALERTDAEGKKTKMSLGEVFSSGEGLSKSIKNFIDLNPTNDSPNADDEFYKAIENYKKTNPDTMFNFDVVDRTRVERAMNMTEVRSFMPKAINNYVNPKNLTEYKGTIGGAEAGGRGNIGAHYPGDPKRTAYGLYGFTESTWIENINKIPELAGLSKAEKLKMRDNPEIEDQVMDIFTMDNMNYLTKSLGRDVTWDEVNMAHFLGPKGASNFIKAFMRNPNTKVADVVDADSIKNNPQILGGGATLLQAWNKRLKRTDTGFDQYMSDIYGVSGDVPGFDYLGNLSDDDLEAQ